MANSIITKDDLNYLINQSNSNLNIIVAGMTSLLSDTDSKIHLLENQTWFQRMCYTVSGHNKMTKEEIQRNHNKISVYMSQALSILVEQQCLDRQVILSLGNQLNEIYASHIELKQMLGAFIYKINNKIESVDNFHILITEIEQGVYSENSPLTNICRIFSKVDNRCIENQRKINLVKRSMLEKNLLSEEKKELFYYLSGLQDYPIDEVGQNYIELNSIKENIIAKAVVDILEKLFFQNNSQVLCNKKYIDEINALSIKISLKEIFEELIQSKIDMCNGLIPIAVIQYEIVQTKAEKLFLQCKFDEAFSLFSSLANKKVGRAMYFLGLFYELGLGTIQADEKEAEKWFLKGYKENDLFCTINYLKITDDKNNDEIDFIKLFTEMNDLAHKNNIFAMDELAFMYKDEIGTQKDNKKFYYWLNICVKQKYWKSILSLSYLYYEGKEMKKDLDKSIYWSKIAYELGCIPAFTIWMLCQKEIDNLDSCFEEQYEFVRDASNKGNYYAKMLSFGYELENNFLESKISKSINELLECNNTNILLTVGDCLFDECSGDSFQKNAFNFYAKCVELGDKESYFRLGLCYYKGVGIEQNYCEAYNNFILAEENGCTEVLYYIGLCHYYGRGVQENNNEAIKYFLRAVENEDNNAMNKLGDIYYHGYGVEKDYKEAYSWYKKGAENNNSDSQAMLGVFYDFGYYVEKNIQKSLYWYELAAKDNNSLANFNLGVYYENAIDYEKAYKYYKVAAENDYADALCALATFYYYGKYVDMDDSIAKEYLMKAKRNNSERAKDLLCKWFHISF